MKNKEIFLFEEKSQLSDNFNYIHILKETHKVFINTLIQLKDCSIVSYGANKSIKFWFFSYSFNKLMKQ